MSPKVVASLETVSKKLGESQALDSFDLSICEGELLAVLGPNGAGKTTALNVLLGLRRPDAGIVRLFGADPRNSNARRFIGVTPQNVGMPAQLRVIEVVDLVRAHFRDPWPAPDLLQMFDLAQIASRQIGGLSGGQLRRLAVALAFVGKPRAMFLDEPTTGLDVEARRRVWSLLADFVRDGGTVLLTTHYLEEAEALASRVVIIDRGRSVAQGTVAEITARVGLKRISFRAPAPPVLSDGSFLTRDGDRYVVTARDSDRAVREIALSCDFRDLTLQGVSLEEAFRWLIRETR